MGQKKSCTGTHDDACIQWVYALIGVDYAWMYEMFYTYDALIGVSVQSVSAMDECYASKVAKQKANSHRWFQLKVYKCLLAFTQHCKALQVSILLMWDWWVQNGVLMWLIRLRLKSSAAQYPQPACTSYPDLRWHKMIWARTLAGSGRVSRLTKPRSRL